jgi:hypothetical protein
MRHTEEEVSRFKAIDDEGKRYTIIEMQRFIHAKDMDGEEMKARGLKRLMLRSGEPVNYIDDSTFEIVRTGKIARKIG